ncbi:MAG: hypothetical protein M1833_001740 [Piccolia ochrophora]|nr:MAG: hypothetical protein M1833_001740 [Piccolia ochrophora]
MLFNIIVATAPLLLLPGVAALPQSQGSTAATGGDVSYTMYKGDGRDGWPVKDEWLSFDELYVTSYLQFEPTKAHFLPRWDQNKDVIGKNCEETHSEKSNEDKETKAIKEAIEDIAPKYQVPTNYALAVVLQESQGCVRAPTTNTGTPSRGLMQCQGKPSCNDNDPKLVNSGQSPCPQSTIEGMIEEGIKVLASYVKENEDATAHYVAFRRYNSYQVDTSDLSVGLGTRCYCSDVANRLVGWVNDGKNPTTCTLK